MKHGFMIIGVATLTALFYAGDVASAQSNFDTWAKAVSSQNNSTAAAETGDPQLQWTAPDGRRIHLTVKVPRPLTSAPIVNLPAVPEGADARPYFEAALARVRATKAGRLVIPKATYVFRSMGGDGQLVIHDLSDVTIDGSGSTFVFMLNKTGIYLTKSKRVELTNIAVEFGLKMGAMATMVTKDGQNVLQFDPEYPVTEKDSIGHISEYDRAAKSFVPGGQRVYSPPGSATSPKYIGDQSYTSQAFQNKALAGKSFVVFQHWYGGSAIQIQDTYGPNQNEDIILDHVTVYSGPGMGIVAYGVKRGLGIFNSQVTVKPGSLISTEYDALHMLLVGGDVFIRDNLISGQGDDGINLNNPVTPIIKTDNEGKNLTLGIFSRFMQANDRLSFFDNTNKFLGISQIVSAPVFQGGPNNWYYSLTLKDPIAGLTTANLVRDMDLVNSRVAVVNNRIENCQCHAILVGTPNTLIEGNQITNTSANPIRLLTNLGSFKEGVGAINVLVRKNNIISSGVDAGLHLMKWSAISAYAATPTGISNMPSNKFLDIVDNTITNAAQGCITVASSVAVHISGNTCNSTNRLNPGGAGITVVNSGNVILNQNKRTGSSTGGIFVDPASTTNIQGQTTY
jgi:hypothetical protein